LTGKKEWLAAASRHLWKKLGTHSKSSKHSLPTILTTRGMMTMTNNGMKNLSSGKPGIGKAG